MIGLLVLAILSNLSYVTSVDYIATVNVETAGPCPGMENHFLLRFFDVSHVTTFQNEDDLMTVDGYATLLFNFKRNAVFTFKADMLKHSGGRWVDTGLGVHRQNACATFFSESEVWHEFVKDFTGPAAQCPPTIGTRYEFHNKTVFIIIKNAPPTMEGTYRSTIHVDFVDDFMCLMFDADVRKKPTRRRLH